MLLTMAYRRKGAMTYFAVHWETHGRPPPFAAHYSVRFPRCWQGGLLAVITAAHDPIRKVV
jgi:hypothetical protein